MIDVCLDAGLNLLDSADVYSDGASESVLGGALAGCRHRTTISPRSACTPAQGPTMRAAHASTLSARSMRSFAECP